MDLVKIVDGAITRLPEGDHSLGLKAVRRHISAAIRHFDRDDGGDLDSFTDAIYRTNQAFEGGLKEAYRVLAGKDPAKLSPYQIETYLEENSIIRPRALKQLTRYREDYRNPSTHDYKLDFDADEALLAIVSVCAFTKLLADQIGIKLISNDASSVAAGASISDTDVKGFAEQLSNVIASVLSKHDKNSLRSNDELLGYVDGVLLGSGLSTHPVLDNDGDDPSEPWDNVASNNQFNIPIECRTYPGLNFAHSMDYILRNMADNHVDTVIKVVLFRGDDNNFRTYKYSEDGLTVFLVSQPLDSDDIPEEVKATLSQYFSD